MVTPNSTKGISTKEAYQEQDGWLNSVLETLDYPGNIARSSILGATRGGLEGALEYGKQAFDKERLTTPTQIKDLVTGGHRFGKDDRVFQWGDVGDFSLDLVTDIVTDPLTYLTFGWGNIARKLGTGAAKSGGKSAGKVTYAGLSDFAKNSPKAKEAYDLAKAGKVDDFRATARQLIGSAADEGIDIVDPGSYADDLVSLMQNYKGVARYQGSELAARAGLGGVYGAGLSDQDSSTLEKALNFGIGAGITAAGGKAAPYIGSALTKVSDDLVEAYARGTRAQKGGDIFTTREGHKGLGPMSRLLNAALPKMVQKANAVKAGRMEILSKYSKPERVSAQQTMISLHEHSIAKRNADDQLQELIEEFGAESPEALARMEVVDKATKAEIEAPGGLLDQLVAQEGKNTRQIIEELGEYNNKLVREMNEKSRKDKSPLFSIKYWMPTIPEAMDANALKAKLFKEADRVNREVSAKHVLQEKGIQSIKSEERFKSVKELQEQLISQGTPKQRADEQWVLDQKDKAFTQVFDNYANTNASQWMGEQVRIAQRMMQAYKNTVPDHKTIENWETGLKYFDKFGNFMKTNMLFFSTSWFINNLWDNMGKSWVENGLTGLVDHKAAKRMFDGTYKDVVKLAEGKPVTHTSDEVMDAYKMGVINSSQVDSFLDKKYADAILNEQNAKKILEKDEFFQKFGKGKNLAQGTTEFAKKAAERWMDILNKSVGRAGTYMEGSSRMMVYKNHKRLLKDSGLSKDSIREIAAKATADAFFDYDQITHLERAVFKRLFPFWSFYSKNLPYWTKAILDPQKASKISALDSVRTNIGEPVPERVNRGLTDYLKHAAPRYMGVDGKDYKLLITPSMSYHDAIMMVDPSATNAWHQIVEKANPFFKVPVEIMTGKDFFTGQYLYPSQTLDGEKYLFSKGFKWYAANKALDWSGLGKDGWLNVANVFPGEIYIDKNGQPKNLSDWGVATTKILEMFFPTPAIDMLAGKIGKTVYGKETINAELMKMMFPMKVAKTNKKYNDLIYTMGKKKERIRKKLDRKRAESQKKARAKREAN